MSISILLADDHKVFRERMRRLLDREPRMKVLDTAANGKDAVRLAQELHPDVVIMDISMPEMNGVDATKEIKKIMPHTKVLCLTVHSERYFVSAMFRAGAIGYVLKDCPFEELARAIAVVHSGKAYASRQVAHYINDKIVPQTLANNEEPDK